MKRTVFIVDDDMDDREIIRDAFISSADAEPGYAFIENVVKLKDQLQQ